MDWLEKLFDERNIEKCNEQLDSWREKFEYEDERDE